MLSPIKQYEEYIKAYRDLIYSKVSLKLGAYSAHIKAFERETYDMEKAYPLMPLMIESIQIDCVMTIAKLVESKNRSDRNIHRFLAFIEGNKKEIKKQYALTDQLINEQKQSLRSIEGRITSILTQRDKYFAHADKEYFFEPSLIMNDFPDTYVDLVSIIKVLQSIVIKHCVLISGSSPVCISGFAYGATAKILGHIKESEKKWHKKYRSEASW